MRQLLVGPLTQLGWLITSAGASAFTADTTCALLGAKKSGLGGVGARMATRAPSFTAWSMVTR